MHKNIILKTFIALLLPAIAGNFSRSAAQEPMKSTPLVQEFLPDEYNAGRQNWQIVQDSRGFLYFANNTGVLQYDGEFWRVIPIDNQSVVRSLYVSPDDKIFVGAANEIGCLAADTKGQYHYRSLVDKIPASDRNFNEVWKIFAGEKGIYFFSFSHVFLYRDGQIETLIRDEPLHFAFQADSTLYLQHEKKGLLQYNGYEFDIAENRIFNKKNEIWTMLPYDEKKILIGTEQNGLYFFHKKTKKVSRTNWESNGFLAENQIFSGIQVNDSIYAFGTIQNGLVLLNRSGDIIRHINKKSGIPNNTILTLYTDKRQQLYLGLDNGIAAIDIHSPVSLYSESSGVFGAGYAAYDTDDFRYFGTNQGLFVQNKNPGAQKDMNTHIIKGTEGQIWNIQKIGNSIICSHNKGAFLIKGEHAEPLYEGTGVWTFLPLKNSRSKLLAGLYEGLALFEFRDNHLHFVSRVKGFNESSRTLFEDHRGNLWMAHGYKGVFKIQLNQNYDSVTSYELYGAQDGLPSNFGNELLVFRNSLGIATQNGIYSYHTETNHFRKGYKYDLLFKNLPVKKAFEDRYRRIWLFRENRLSYIKKNKDGKNELHNDPIGEFNSRLIPAFENITLTTDGHVLIGYDNGFILYENRHETEKKIKLKAFIRKVIINNFSSDSVVYVGDGGPESLKKLRLSYKNNSVKFNFSASLKKPNQTIKYRLLIPELHKGWSQWQEQAYKEFSNLPPGEYTLQVQAGYASGEKSETDTFRFEIQPPWYSGKTAVAVYIPTVLLLLLGGIKMISAKIKKERKLLMEEQEKELKQREERHRHKQLQQEQEITKLRNERLTHQIAKQKQEADARNRELSSVAMQITHKNEILSKLKKEINKLAENSNSKTRKELRKLSRAIDDDVRLDEDWERFKAHFELVHNGFFRRLREKHENITPKEQKLCAYLRMNLSSKEIAPLMNISARSVENSRYRLRKKFNLDKETNLTDYILDI